MVQQPEPLDAMAFYVGETVEVGSDVVIASGAVLVSAPGSRLVIEPGVCIGTGVVVQAFGGDLLLACGASLGMGVLVLGTGTVGAGACIGAESTVLNPTIGAHEVIPARSLLGIPVVPQGSASQPPPTPNGRPSMNGQSSQQDADVAVEDGDGALAPAVCVYGRDQVMQLVKTLFPHRDLLKAPQDLS